MPITPDNNDDQLLDRALHDRYLDAARKQNLGIVDALTVSVGSFENLKGLTAQELQEKLKDLASLPEPERRALTLIEAISKLTQEEMRSMNKTHPGLPPDTLQKTLDLVTQPGASVVVLTGQPNATFGEAHEVLGYGVVIRGKENFPEWRAEDPDHRIPEYLFEGSNIQHRLIRLFVRDSARDQETTGKAFDLIINKVKDICHNEPIIGMVLTDLFCLSEADKLASFDNRIWLAAMNALKRRGFEDADCGFTETIAQEGFPVVGINFRWWTFPARTDSGRSQYEQSQAKFAELEAYRQAQLAGVVARIPASGGKVIYAGPTQAALALAGVTGNVVINETFPCSDPSANKPGRRMNLISLPEESGLGLPAESVDSVALNGILPDVARKGAEPLGAIKAFAAQRALALKTGGTLIVRDTVAPSDNAPVYLYLSNETQLPWSEGRTVAQIFEEFVRTRNEKSIDDIEWSQVTRQSDTPSLSCFYLPARIAAEFLLKYPYLKTWDRERQREYTLHTVEDRVQLGRELGLRLVYAAPEFSPYVARQHLLAGVSLRTTYGAVLEPLPTNHLTVWQKVTPEQGLEITPGNKIEMTGERFVQVTRYEEFDKAGRSTGFQEVATRPGRTIDVIPFRIDNGRLYVWGREFPRPITTVHPYLDGARYGGYLSEQLAGIVFKKDLDNPEVRRDETRSIFERVTGRTFPDTACIHDASTYLVKPDTVDEVVLSTAIEVDDFPLYNTVITNPGLAFSGSYSLHAFDGVRVLQGAQVGHSLDARLERKVYQLLVENQLSCGAWLGERGLLRTQNQPMWSLSEPKALMNLPAHAPFKIALDQKPRFLTACRQEFVEHSAAGEQHDRKRALDYVEPDLARGFSHHSLSLLPVAKMRDANGGEEIIVGLEMRDLPAVQQQMGSSCFLTLPTTRLPRGARTMEEARTHGRDTLSRVYGLSTTTITSLGGKYAVSPGATPETVYPFLVEVNLAKTNHDSLKWVRLKDLVPLLPKFHCAQLITSAYRAAHSFGYLK